MQVDMTSNAALTQTTSMPALLSPEQGLRKYLQEIAQFPVLSPEEEQALAIRWRDHQDVDAAHQLVTSHLRLVAKIAFKYRGYGLPIADLIAEGNIGLMQAVKRFEPEKGFRLSTYAMWWIRASIQEFILKSWSLVKIGTSATQKRLFFNLRKLKKKIGASDRGMTDEQINDVARILDVKPEDVVDMDSRMSGSDVYLNSAAGPEGDEEKIAFLPDTRDNQETLLGNKEELIAKQILLQKALETLSERERDILKRRRLKDEPDTLEDLSQAYGISRERVRQIEVRAFEKLQKEMVS
jgi:RNA polymerase sigma-32 factor